MFTEEGKGNREWLCDIRNRIIDLLEEEGVTGRIEASEVLASTLNEIMAPHNYSVAIILRPLVFSEDDGKK